MKQKLWEDAVLEGLCLTMADCLAAGMLPGDALSLLADQQEQPKYKAVLEAAAADAAQGTLCDALGGVGVFPDYLLEMVRVGEQTGNVEPVFRDMAAYYQRQDQLRRQLRSAVAYPLLLTVILLAVFAVFLTQVMPVFARVYGQVGAQMPASAQVFLSLGLWLSAHGWLLLGILIALAAVGAALYFIPAAHSAVSGWLSRAFAKCATGRAVAQSRICTVLALTVPACDDTISALSLARCFASGREEEFDRAMTLVEEGQSMTSALRETGLITGSASRLLDMGERTGSLEGNLDYVAQKARTEADEAVDRLAGRVEPALVIVLTVLVGLLLLTVMLPLAGILSAF